MADGIITGDEILKGVTEKITEAHEAFKLFVSDYNEFSKSINNVKTSAQANTILAKNIELQKKNVDLLIKQERLEKEKANAIKAKKLADSATFKTFGQANTALAKNIELQKKNVDLLIKQERLEKEKANTIKSKTLAASAELNLTKKQTAGSKSNLRAQRQLKSEYAQQSRVLIVLRNAYKDLEIKKQLGQTLTKKETVEYERLRKKVLSLDAALKKTDTAAGQFQRNVGNYASGLKNLFSAARGLISAFGLTSGVFLFANALKSAFAKVNDFDKSMQNLAGVMRTSRSDISDIEKEIIKVSGASIKTSREVAVLAEELATLGKTKDEIKQLLQPANDLSIALNTTSGEAAKFLVQTLNAFGKPASAANEFADTIATIRTSTTLDFERMRDSFQYLAPISRILGKDLAYTGSLIGILADNGIKAERAGRLLSTSQQKLAAESMSLDEALVQINKAQQEGATGLEQLALASKLFGKQSAGIAVVLANNTDAIENNAQAIRDNGGALKDLVNTQLRSVDAKLKIVSATWESFILTIDNGNGSISTAIKELADYATQLLKTYTRLENIQTRIKTVTNVDASVPFLGPISKEASDLIKLQKGFDDINSNLEFHDLDTLKGDLEEYNKELETNNNLTLHERELYRAQAKVIENAILLRNRESDGLDKNTDATNSQNDSKKILNNVLSKTKVFLRGTVSYYENEISKEKEVQKNTALTSEAFQNSERKIRDYQKAIDDLSKTLEKVNTVTIGTTQQQNAESIKKTKEILDSFTDTLGTKLGIDAIKIPDTNDLFKPITDGYKNVTKEAGLSAQKQSEIFGALFNTFGKYYNLDLSAFGDLIAVKDAKNKGSALKNIDYARTADSIVNKVYDDKFKKYDEEQRKNQETLDVILNDKNASDKKKEQAQKEFDRKEAKIKIKKAKADREATLIQIGIDGAAAAVKALPKFYLAAAVLAFAGLEAAFVSSQPLPQYFMGKGLGDNYQGMATWGERRKEVKISGLGGVEVSPNKTTPLFVKKDDIIVPSLSRFDQKMNDPTSDVFRRVSRRIDSNVKKGGSFFAVNMIDSKEIGRSVERAMEKYANRPNVWNGTINTTPTRTRYHG